MRTVVLYTNLNTVDVLSGRSSLGPPHLPHRWRLVSGPPKAQQIPRATIPPLFFAQFVSCCALVTTVLSKNKKWATENADRVMSSQER